MEESTISELCLRVEEISLTFGGLTALDKVSLLVAERELVAIIGPNGAGKTCLLNSINGFYRPHKGEIYFHGHNLVSLPPHRIAEMGIARTFQNIELYAGMTTLDNLLAARHIRMKSTLFSDALYFGPSHREEILHREAVEGVIDFLEMESIRKKVVGSLPYGQRKKVELGRALAMEPKLLLLDEPMAGMNLEEKEDMARFILDIHEEKNIPIVLIEHDMGVVMDLADKVVVLDFGREIAKGTPEEIKINPRVIQAYLGKEMKQGL